MFATETSAPLRAAAPLVVLVVLPPQAAMARGTAPTRSVGRMIERLMPGTTGATALRVWPGFPQGSWRRAPRLRGVQPGAHPTPLRAHAPRFVHVAQGC